MAEEMGLILNIISKLDPGSAARVKSQLESQMNVGLKSVGVGKGAPTDITKGLQKSLAAGNLFGGIKGALAAGGMGGLTGGLVVGALDGIKSAVTKIWDLFRQSSPVLQRSLKMIQLGIMNMVRPFADTLGRILYPIARFFMLWGRAIYAEYREKYKEYVAGGMSPMEASIKASTEAFIDGIVGLFTGVIGDIDLHSSILTIIDSFVGAFIKTISDPAVMVDLLLIGGMIIGAVGLALMGAAVTFLAAMQGIAWLISAAAALGLTTSSSVFAAMGATIAGIIGSAVTLGLAALPVLIAGSVLVASTWLSDEINKMLGWKQPQGEYADHVAELIHGGPFWPWEEGFKWPWEHAAGGIFTKPTMGVIGEAGPEAVIPLSKMGGLGGSVVNITITGNNINKEIDLERTITRALDDYLREFVRGR